MRSSGAAGSIRPKPLKPGRPLVAASFAAVPGTTIQTTSARRTATGTPPTTGTTTWVSGSPARFPPEPAPSRWRRVCAKRPGPSMMSTVGAPTAPDTAAAPVLGDASGSDRRRRLTFHDPQRHLHGEDGRRLQAESQAPPTNFRFWRPPGVPERAGKVAKGRICRVRRAAIERRLFARSGRPCRLRKAQSPKRSSAQARKWVLVRLSKLPELRNLPRYFIRSM